MDDKIRQQISDAKRRLGRQNGRLKTAFAEVTDAMKAETDRIQQAAATGRSVIPEVAFRQIRDDKVADDLRDRIRHAGAVIVRGVFERARAEDWNEELGAYVESNGYYEMERQKRGLDKYFSELQSDKPQILGVYWSKPQVMARQAESMAATKRFLNRLWQVPTADGSEFDPDHDFAYADRTRRREPGDTSLGLSPHIDAGSYERWVDPAFQTIYAPVFAGAWRDYDPWNAAMRTRTREYPSPAVCSMFRTFQGWTALSDQGPRDGTLQLVPIANAMIYILLRALQEDVADDDLCGALPGRALSATPQWHGPLLEGLVSIPAVAPGDTVWWHPDVIHGVEDEHAGTGFSNVIYIGASPRCAKNESYVKKQARAFLDGRSAPDFAAEDYEVGFHGRATLDDLSELGRGQMGL